MPSEQRDPTFAPRLLVRIVLAIVVPSLALIPFLFPLRGPQSAWEIALFVAAPVTTAILGCVLVSRLHRRYRCPRCGAHLPPQKPESSRKFEYCFVCPSCDVVWTTGVFHGQG